MILTFEDKKDSRKYDGIALLLEDKAMISYDNFDFDLLTDKFCKKYKISKTRVLGESIRLLFKKTPEKITISEFRLMDKFQLAKTKEVSFSTLFKEFGKS